MESPPKVVRPLYARPVLRRRIKVESLLAGRLERIATRLRRDAKRLTDDAVEAYRS